MIRVWDTESGAILDEKAFSDGPLSMLLVDDRLWIGSRNNLIRVYDLKTISCVKILTGHKGWVTCLERVGPEIWSGSADRTMRVWNAADLVCIQKIEGFRGWMYSVASLGTVLWASCSDQKIRVYGITEPKKPAIQGEVPDDIRPRSMSSTRPRGLTINKKKCVDVGTQTTFQFPPVLEEQKPPLESTPGHPTLLALDAVKRVGSSSEFFDDHRTQISYGDDENDDDLSDYSLSDFSDLDGDIEDLNDTTMPGGHEAFQDELLDEINAKNKQLEELHQQVITLQALQKRTEDALKLARENQDHSSAQQQITEQELLAANLVLEGTNRQLQAQVRKYEEQEMQRLLMQPESPTTPVVPAFPKPPSVDSHGVQTDAVAEPVRPTMAPGVTQTDLVGEVVSPDSVILPTPPPPVVVERIPEEPQAPRQVATQGSQTRSSWQTATAGTQVEVAQTRHSHTQMEAAQTANAQTHMEAVQTSTAGVDTVDLTTSRASESQTDDPRRHLSSSGVQVGPDETDGRDDEEGEAVDSDAEGELPEDVLKPKDRRLAKLSIVSTHSAESGSGSDTMLLLCNICNQHINVADLEEHSRTCQVMSPVRAVQWEVLEGATEKKGSKEDETLVRDVKYERDEQDVEFDGEIKKLEQRLEEVTSKLKDLQERAKKGDTSNDADILKHLEEQLRLKDQLIALLRSQKMHTMVRN